MKPNLMTAIVLLAVASTAAAQSTPAQSRVKEEKLPVRVFVTDGEWRGRLIDMDADSVTIQPPNGPPRTLPLSGVIRIEAQKRDSIVNGAIIGGVVTTLWCLVVCGQGASTTSSVPGIVVGNAVMGMLLGGIIDAAHPARVTLYRRPEPAVTGRGHGVFVTLRF